MDEIKDQELTNTACGWCENVSYGLSCMSNQEGFQQRRDLPWSRFNRLTLLLCCKQTTGAKAEAERPVKGCICRLGLLSQNIIDWVVQVTEMYFLTVL